MKTTTFHTYEPEDLERLMRTKSFDELLPEERTFVLRHVTDSEEYGQVRQLMIDVEGAEHDLFDPPASVWKNLQREFRNQKKSLFVHWLNLLAQRWSEFTSLQRVAYSGLAMTAVVTLLALPYIAKKDVQSSPVILSENHTENSLQPELKNSVPTPIKQENAPAEITHIEPPLNEVYKMDSWGRMAEASVESADDRDETNVEAPAENLAEKKSVSESERFGISSSSSHLPANASVSNYLYDSAPAFNVTSDVAPNTANTTDKINKTKTELAQDSLAKIRSKSLPVKKKKKKKTH